MVVRVPSVVVKLIGVGGAVGGGGGGGETGWRRGRDATQPRRHVARRQRRQHGGVVAGRLEVVVVVVVVQWRSEAAGVKVGVDDVEVEVVWRDVGHVVRRLQRPVDPEEPLGRRRCSQPRRHAIQVTSILRGCHEETAPREI